MCALGLAGGLPGRFWKNMIDLHCHILPGVDDGAAGLEVSCRMAELASGCGIDTIVATPHCNTRNAQGNYRSPELLARCRRLQQALDEAHIGVRILPGAEVLMRGDLPALLEQKRLQSLNNSRYLLVEFYFDEPPEYMLRCLHLVKKAGYVPVVAHPERYGAVQDDPGLAVYWAQNGCVLQANKGSLLGRLGQGSLRTSQTLLRRGFYAAIASDAHGCEVRTPDMRQLCAALERQYPVEYLQLLLYENPMRILHDRPIVPFSREDGAP